jgi:hypothetical protein
VTTSEGERFGGSALLAAAVSLLLAIGGGPGSAARDPTRLSFTQPVYVSQGAAFHAAEPSIRVDANDPTHRIWVAAPTGIGVKYSVATRVARGRRPCLVLGRQR